MARKRTLIGLAVALSLGAIVAFYSFDQEVLPNLRVVRGDVLWRSGTPNRLGLWLAHQAGVKTIVNLRSLNAAENAREADFARRHGMTFVAIPLRFSGAGIDAVASAFIDVVADPARQPVLVHCARGKERSGVCTAVFRIECDGWTNAEALAEMYAHGVTPGSLPELEAFVRDYRPSAAGRAEGTMASEGSRQSSSAGAMP